MSSDRGICNDPAASRIRGVTATVVAGLMAGFLLSTKLWVSTRSFPLTPVWSRWPTLPYPFDYILLAAMSAVLIGVAVHPRPRGWLIAFLVLAGLAAFGDQSRWQPWFYQYYFLCVALAMYPWGRASSTRPEAALNACRIIVASTYFWSGLQKLNPSFQGEGVAWLMQPLLPLLPAPVQTTLLAAGSAVPFLEAALGIGLLMPRLRNVAVVGVVAMHALLLLALGPLGHNWNSVVWPWNGAMAVLTVLLFGNTRSVSFGAVLLPRRHAGYALTACLFGVMPAASFVNLWDAYLSAALYSENTLSAVIEVREPVFERLPPEVQAQFDVAGEGWHRLELGHWTMSELNVPPYPERRVFVRVARHIGSFAEDPADVVLVIQERPEGWTTARAKSRLSGAEWD